MIFSILIPTLPERQDKLDRLVQSITAQGHTDKVQILWDRSGREVPTGTKRNTLLHSCETKYFAFVDDDDLLPDYYVSEMLNAMEKDPDVITFIGYMTTNGKDRRNFTIKLGSRYEEKNGHFYRFPNHLCAFKRDLVKHISFPEVWQQEDYMWAKTIEQRHILKTEVHIQRDMYHYDFRTNKPPYAKPASVR